MTPFKALYGYPPPKVLDYVASTTRVDAMDLLLRDKTTDSVFAQAELVCCSRMYEVVY